MTVFSSSNCQCDCTPLNDQNGSANKNKHPTDAYREAPDTITRSDLPVGVWTYVGGFSGGGKEEIFAIDTSGVVYWKGIGFTEWGEPRPKGFEVCPFLAGHSWQKAESGWALRGDGKLLIWGATRGIFFDNSSKFGTRRADGSVVQVGANSIRKISLDCDKQGVALPEVIGYDDILASSPSFNLASNPAGHWYTETPDVSFSLTNTDEAGSQIPPSGFATIRGHIAGIYVTQGGSGYTTPPAVTIAGGGGDGATADAWLNQDGEVCFINITNAGYGYSSAPTVTISAPPAEGGQTAAATAEIIGRLQDITLTNRGSVRSNPRFSLLRKPTDRTELIVKSQLGSSEKWRGYPFTVQSPPSPIDRFIPYNSHLGNDGLFLAVDSTSGAGSFTPIFSNALSTPPGHVIGGGVKHLGQVISDGMPAILDMTFIGHGDGSTPTAYFSQVAGEPNTYDLWADLSTVTQSRESRVEVGVVYERYEAVYMDGDGVSFPPVYGPPSYYNKIVNWKTNYFPACTIGVSPAAVFRLIRDDVPGGYAELTQVSVSSNGEIDTSVPSSISNVNFTNPVCTYYTYDPRPYYLSETFSDVDSVYPFAAVTAGGGVYLGDNRYKIQSSYVFPDFQQMRYAYLSWPSGWGSPIIRGGDPEPNAHNGYSAIDMFCGHGVIGSSYSLFLPGTYFQSRGGFGSRSVTVFDPNTYRVASGLLGIVHGNSLRLDRLSSAHLNRDETENREATNPVTGTTSSYRYQTRRYSYDPTYIAPQSWAVCNPIRNPSSGEWNGVRLNFMPSQWAVKELVVTDTITDPFPYPGTTVRTFQSSLFQISDPPQVQSYSVPTLSVAAITNPKQAFAGGQTADRDNAEFNYYNLSRWSAADRAPSTSRYLVLQDGSLLSFQGAVYTPEPRDARSHSDYDLALASDRWVWYISGASKNFVGLDVMGNRSPVRLPGGYPAIIRGFSFRYGFPGSIRRWGVYDPGGGTPVATPEAASLYTDNFGDGRLYPSGVTFSQSPELPVSLFCGTRPRTVYGLPLYVRGGMNKIFRSQSQSAGVFAADLSGNLWSLDNLTGSTSPYSKAPIHSATPLIFDLNFTKRSPSFPGDRRDVTASGIANIAAELAGVQFLHPLQISITNEGSGYKAPAQVLVGSEYQNPSARTGNNFWDHSQRASWSSHGTGKVGGISVLETGGGFRQPPQVLVDGNATAVAHIQGPIEKFEITNPGSGYLFPPEVTISGPGIHPEKFSVAARLNESGGVESISIEDNESLTVYPRLAGSDASLSSQAFSDSYSTAHPYPLGLYASPPTVTILPPSGVSQISVSSGGQMYQSPPAVRILSYTGKEASATAFISGPVHSFAVTNAGSGYEYPPIISLSITDPPPDVDFENVIPTPSDITATIDSEGKVTSIQITGNAGNVCVPPTVEVTPVAGVVGIELEENGGGSGYDPENPPSVSVTTTNGSPIAVAVAAARVNAGGEVESVEIRSTGGGYDGLIVEVTIDPPPQGSGGTQATATAVLGPTGGSGASATSVIDGSVYEVAVVSSGYGYEAGGVDVLLLGGASGRLDTQLATATATVSRGAGSGATANAVIDGKLLYVEVQSSGSGYTATPNVSISPQNGASCQAKLIFKTDDFTFTKTQGDYYAGVANNGERGLYSSGDDVLEGVVIGNFLLPDSIEGSELLYSKAIMPSYGSTPAAVYSQSLPSNSARSCVDSIFPTAYQRLKNPVPNGVYSTTPPAVVSSMQSIIARPVTEITRNGYCLSGEIWRSEKYNGQVNFFPFLPARSDGFFASRTSRIFPFYPMTGYYSNEKSGARVSEGTYSCYVCNSTNQIPNDLCLAFNLETSRGIGSWGSESYLAVAFSGHHSKSATLSRAPGSRQVKWEFPANTAKVIVQDASATPAEGLVGSTVDSVVWSSGGSGTFRTSTATQILEIPRGSWKERPEFDVSVNSSGEIESISTTKRGVFHKEERDGVDIVAHGTGEGFFASPRFARKVLAVKVSYSKGWDSGAVYMRSSFADFVGQSFPDGNTKTSALRRPVSGAAFSGSVVFVGGSPIEAASASASGLDINVTSGGLYEGTPLAYLVSGDGVYRQLDVLMDEDIVLYGIEVAVGGRGFSQETEIVVRKKKPLQRVYTPGFVTDFAEVFKHDGGDKNLADVLDDDFTSSASAKDEQGIGLGDACGLLRSSATLYPEFAADIGIVSKPYSPSAIKQTERLFSDNWCGREFSAGSSVLKTFEDGRVVSCTISYVSCTQIGTGGRGDLSAFHGDRSGLYSRTDAHFSPAAHGYVDGTLLPLNLDAYSRPFPASGANFPGEADEPSTFVATIRPVSLVNELHSI